MSNEIDKDMEEYVRNEGNACPFCGSESIETRGSIESDSGVCWQDVACAECEKAWQDVYKLHSYIVLD